MLNMYALAMVGIYLLFDLGLIKLSIKPLILGGNVLGGLIFGIGWGIVGYCPATAMGALGEGRYDSAFGLLGMILGAGLYAEAYPRMKETVLTWGDFGKITFPLEVIVETIKNFEERKAWPTLERKIAREGKVLSAA
jgi:uncharacterized membrane protein YedE/YeeE